MHDYRCMNKVCMIGAEHANTEWYGNNYIARLEYTKRSTECIKVALREKMILTVVFKEEPKYQI